METSWFKESLFCGMTANAFKLGTVLTLGWFWTRLSGCSILYRGGSMGTVDFANILTAGGADAGQISVPDYLEHKNDTDYFYVVRRANNCGNQEHTLSAAVKVSIDSDGDLAQAEPNNIFEARAEQAAGDKIRLVWFYCPIEQKSRPACFKLYWDGRSGQIDFETPLVSIDYAGRKFYSYTTDELQAGTYLFCIRAEDAAGADDKSWAQLKIQLAADSPEAIDILSTEVI
ncbi:MAG: hypothetical protein JXB29_04280 [Sedimentisphaerales bacterium]|nr:hypothetical protein [Sedimentisphaerales bacterium]